MNKLITAALAASVLAPSGMMDYTHSDSSYPLSMPDPVTGFYSGKKLSLAMHQMNFNWRSQRQNRKNARRRFAAGYGRKGAQKGW